jgi:hypothetical protein
LLNEHYFLNSRRRPSSAWYECSVWWTNRLYRETIVWI